MTIIEANNTEPGAIDSPEPQVLYKCQRLIIQKNQRFKVSDHAPYKNKNTMSRCSTIRVMDRKSIKSTQSGECHQLTKSYKHRFMPGRYNPLEDVANINKLERLHFTKLKTSVTRVTI